MDLETKLRLIDMGCDPLNPKLISLGEMAELIKSSDESELFFLIDGSFGGELRIENVFQQDLKSFCEKQLFIKKDDFYKCLYLKGDKGTIRLNLSDSFSYQSKSWKEDLVMNFNSIELWVYESYHLDVYNFKRKSKLSAYYFRELLGNHFGLESGSCLTIGYGDAVYNDKVKFLFGESSSAYTVKVLFDDKITVSDVKGFLEGGGLGDSLSLINDDECHYVPRPDFRSFDDSDEYQCFSLDFREAPELAVLFRRVIDFLD